MEINRVTGILNSRKSQVKLSGLRPNRPENISPKKFGNSSKADLKFFVPLAVMQTQNSKGRQIFQGKKFKIRSGQILRIVDL